MFEIDLAYVTAHPQGALDMIERLMDERDQAKALAAAAAAGPDEQAVAWDGLR